METVGHGCFKVISGASTRTRRVPGAIQVGHGCFKLGASTRTRYQTQFIRLAMDRMYIRDLLEDGVYRLEFVPSKDNIADILTKPLKPTTFIRLRQRLGIGPYESD